MFERLSESLQKVFRTLRGYGRISERNAQEALREVRLALLEADVNYQVARDFIQRVKERALGKDVLESITPGQQFVKHVYDELTGLLGGARRDFDWSVKPALVMLLGLHGAGKTTTAGKLALRWKKEGRRVLLVACDLRRPAAVEQLKVLGAQTRTDVLAPDKGENIDALAARARKAAEHYDAVIFDTGGRFQIDEELVAELKRLREDLQPRNIVLVLDAAIGQESVHVAETFHREVGLTGLILTKLDGDARGGAALSVHAVTGCPILLVGTGEKPEDLEPFYPERMASRILGMGDVVSLVEKAQQAMDEKEMQRVQEALEEGRFDLNDFLQQLRQMKKLGSLQDVIRLLPGAERAMPEGVSSEVFERDLKRMEAILCSMTPEERRKPGLLNAGRKRRIAAGSGTRVQDVNDLLRNFEKARQMAGQMKQMRKRLIGRGK
jgi:signal recognition particle subunit SRP54